MINQLVEKIKKTNAPVVVGLDPMLSYIPEHILKKAYDELEQEGYIVSIQGKGTFVAPKNKELAQEQAQKEIESYFIKAINIAERYNIRKENLVELIDMLYGSDDK